MTRYTLRFSCNWVVIALCFVFASCSGRFNPTKQNQDGYVDPSDSIVPGEDLSPGDSHQVTDSTGVGDHVAPDAGDIVSGDSGDMAGTDSSVLAICQPCQVDANCSPALRCVDWLCLPESRQQRGDMCHCDEHCDTGLKCVEALCTVYPPLTTLSAGAVPGRVASHDCFSGPLMVLSALSEPAYVAADGSFVVDASQSGVQLLILVSGSDEEVEVRGLTLYAVGEELLFDASTTTEALVALTPGLFPADVQGLHQLREKLGKSVEYSMLVDELRNVYCLDSLASAVSQASFQHDIVSINAALTMTASPPTSSATSPPAETLFFKADAGDSLKFTPPRKDEIELLQGSEIGSVKIVNHGWRAVRIIRRQFDASGNILSTIQVKGNPSDPTPMGEYLQGAAPLSWGSMLALCFGCEDDVEDTGAFSNSLVDRVEYWVVGPGLLGQGDPPPSAWAAQCDATDATLMSVIVYVLGPYISNVFGAAAESTMEISKAVASVLSQMGDFWDLAHLLLSGDYTNLELMGTIVDTFIELIRQEEFWDSTLYKKLLVLVPDLTKKVQKVAKGLEKASEIVLNGGNALLFLAHLSDTHQVAHFVVEKGCQSVCEVGVCGYNSCGHLCPSCPSGQVCHLGTCTPPLKCADIYSCMFDNQAVIEYCVSNWIGCNLGCRNNLWNDLAGSLVFDMVASCLKSFCGSSPTAQCVQANLSGVCKPAVDMCLGGGVSCPQNTCTEAAGLGSVVGCVEGNSKAVGCHTDSAGCWTPFPGSGTQCASDTCLVGEGCSEIDCNTSTCQLMQLQPGWHCVWGEYSVLCSEVGADGCRQTLVTATCDTMGCDDLSGRCTSCNEEIRCQSEGWVQHACDGNKSITCAFDPQLGCMVETQEVDCGNGCDLLKGTCNCAPNTCDDPGTSGSVCEYYANGWFSIPCSFTEAGCPAMLTGQGNQCALECSDVTGQCCGGPGESACPQACLDEDGDGYGASGDCPLDCDDTRWAVNPSMSEVCGNTLDDNCDGKVNEACSGCTATEQCGIFCAGCKEKACVDGACVCLVKDYCCGNGTCDSTGPPGMVPENWLTCAADCGGNPTPYCGNGYCDTSENSASCCLDCGCAVGLTCVGTCYNREPGDGRLADAGVGLCMWDGTELSQCPSPWQPGFGQDGSYLAEVPQVTAEDPSLPNNNKVMVDPLTTLRWQCYIPDDSTYVGAQGACSNTGLAGGGWRVPTLRELNTIIYYPQNSIWDGCGSEGGLLDVYWASDKLTNSFAYTVEPGSEHLINARTIELGGVLAKVRCVSGVWTSGPPINNQDGTTTDPTSGLVWSGGPFPELDWQQAISYCEGLTKGGRKWRLPDIRELVDGALAKVISDQSLKGFWSSTPRGNGLVWAVYTNPAGPFPQTTYSSGWAAPRQVACVSSDTSGTCFSDCGDPGSATCVGNGYFECLPQADPDCLQFGAFVPCDSGQYCSDGVCLP